MVIENLNEVRKDMIYNEIKLLVERSDYSWSELSKKLPMYKSRQSLHQAFTNKTIKLDALFSLADVLGKRLIVQFVNRNSDMVNDAPATYENDPTMDAKMMRTLEALSECRQTKEDLRTTIATQRILIDVLTKQLEEYKQGK